MIPLQEFDLIVVGAGSGLDVASAAVRQRMDVAVVEEGPMGGTCLNRGCIPSKMLVHRADLAEQVQRSEEFGIDASIDDIHFSDMVAEVNREVSEDAASIRRGIRNSEQHTLYQEEGRFVDAKTLAVGDEKITADRIVIAAGTRPMIPPIDGLDEVDYLTSTEALELEEQPSHLVIIGGGYIAAELAHFYGALGTEITIIEMTGTLVGNEDEEIRTAFTDIFSEKYDVHLGYAASQVSEADGEITVTAESEDGDEISVTGDELLVAAGRRPNTDTLAVDEAGIETDDRGFVQTDDYLRTTVDGIYALGDIAGNWMFKHAANYEAEVVFRNMFGEDDVTVDYTAMPHAIFSSPQIAGVGKTEQELRDEEVDYLVGRYEYADTGMGAAVKEEDGFAKALVDHGGGEILGFHVIGPHASILIHEVLVAMRSGGTVHDIRDTIHIHPALSEVVARTFGALQHPEHLDHDHGQ
ncbi:MAG: dihydrolipoyl dehydrogenase [Candidatus Nanohaloarchaea archaeon]|nr:dihydrolipoyl dehydrogenase [Candidatus Nanohaloarchaea archaeon]